MSYEIQRYIDAAGDHRWRAVAKNGRIVADSAEGYRNASDMDAMINKLFGASTDIGASMRLIQAQEAAKGAQHVVSRATNMLQQVKIALEEDDYEEAMRLINEAIGE